VTEPKAHRTQTAKPLGRCTDAGRAGRAGRGGLGSVGHVLVTSCLELLANRGRETSEFGMVDRCGSVGEAHIAHVVELQHMHMGVRHFEASDHQADTFRREHRLDGRADVVRYPHHVGRIVGGDVGPLIDFGPRYHQRMAIGYRVDGEKADTNVVAPYEMTRQIAVDNETEDRWHVDIVCWPPASDRTTGQTERRSTSRLHAWRCVRDGAE